MTLQLIETGGQDCAYTLVDPDAPGYKAYVTNADYTGVPCNPEQGEIRFEIYPDNSSESVLSFAAQGRKDLIAWYVRHVGHDPDEDEGPATILDLMERVGAHLLLRAAEQTGKKSADF